MFEKQLAEKLEKIFKIKKVTYDQPADAKEQECIFVTVQQPRVRVKGGKATARVTGNITIHANSEKMPFGYMMKCYEESDPALKETLPFSTWNQMKRFSGTWSSGLQVCLFFQYTIRPKSG